MSEISSFLTIGYRAGKTANYWLCIWFEAKKFNLSLWRIDALDDLFGLLVPVSNFLELIFIFGREGENDSCSLLPLLSSSP